MKRFVSIFVVFVLIVTSVFVTAGIAYGYSGYEDDNDIKYPVKGGYLYFDEKTGAITGCDWDVTKAVIPDEINGVEVVEIVKQAFAYCRALNSVTIPATVTSIGEEAFYCCEALANIEFKGTLKATGEYMFVECDSLEHIELPEGMETISVCTFANCSGLKKIIMPQTINKIDDSAFAGCTSLEEVSLNEGLKEINQQAFEGCVSLKSIFIPSTVNSIANWAFARCKSLADIQVHKDNKIFEVVDDILYATGNQYWKKYDQDFQNDSRELVRCSTNRNGKVVIGEQLNYSIDSGAFSGCSRITDIEINNNENFMKSVNGIIYIYESK